MTTSNEFHRESPTGIKVIVIGAGFAGLAAALECHRQGHDVELFEQAAEFRPLGDLIVLTPNAARVVRHWDSVLDEIYKRCVWAERCYIHDRKGELLHVQQMVLEHNGSPFCNTHRRYFQNAFFSFAKAIGIKINLGVRVEEYFEGESEVGILVEGVKRHADVVIGADGVHSRCRAFITGREEKATSSGYAIYRAWVPFSECQKVPLCRDLLRGGDSMSLFIGPDTHGFIAVSEKMKIVVWFVTHRDVHDIQESYSLLGRKEDVLGFISDWDPRFRALVNITPKDQLIDWKLLWRDPLQQWVSKCGRIAMLGDSAHPFLPTSGNGASQALEDAATLALTLRLAGKADIPLATRAFEKLRYERVTLTQRNGFETRHRWHQINWKEFREDPNTISMPQPEWLYGHDAEKYTRDRWDEIVDHLRNGTPFKSTNTYDGYVHEDWTAAGVMEMEKTTAPSPAVHARTKL